MYQYISTTQHARERPRRTKAHMWPSACRPGASLGTHNLQHWTEFECAQARFLCRCESRATPSRKHAQLSHGVKRKSTLEPTYQRMRHDLYVNQCTTVLGACQRCNPPARARACMRPPWTAQQHHVGSASLSLRDELLTAGSSSQWHLMTPQSQIPHLVHARAGGHLM